MAKVAKAAAPAGITAYCVQTKEKNVPMVDPVINIKNGKYIAVGKSAEGHNMAAILNATKAEAFIADGTATAGEGFEKPKTKKK